MRELTEKITKFNEERDWKQFHSPENLAKSISIEAGELLECFQWNNDYDLNDVCEELADVMNYCIQMADRLGVDPKQIILDKMEKTAKKYPVENQKEKVQSMINFKIDDKIYTKIKEYNLTSSVCVNL